MNTEMKLICEMLVDQDRYIGSDPVGHKCGNDATGFIESSSCGCYLICDQCREMLGQPNPRVSFPPYFGESTGNGAIERQRRIVEEIRKSILTKNSEVDLSPYFTIPEKFQELVYSRPISASWEDKKTDIPAEIGHLMKPPKPDFYLDERGQVQERTGYWMCLHCQKNWNRPTATICFKCRYPKGWLADEDVMRELGWERIKT